MKIEKQLQKNNRSLKDFKPMLYLGNNMIYDERQYNFGAQRVLYQNLFQSLRVISIDYFIRILILQQIDQ